MLRLSVLIPLNSVPWMENLEKLEVRSQSLKRNAVVHKSGSWLVKRVVVFIDRR